MVGLKVALWDETLVVKSVVCWAENLVVKKVDVMVVN
jgi:hypothetical protein